VNEFYQGLFFWKESRLWLFLEHFGLRAGQGFAPINEEFDIKRHFNPFIHVIRCTSYLPARFTVTIHTFNGCNSLNSKAVVKTAPK
jgi:hypothetical protein